MYEKFRQKFKNYLVISLQDIHKAFPNFNSKSLINWQKKGYIIKLRNKFYKFAEKTVDESQLYYISNKIYSPSYVSLESAFSYYGLILEGVYNIQCVSTQKTNSFNTKVGFFNYQTIKKKLYFGYVLKKHQNTTFRMASLEKAILDYFYLRSDIDDYESIEALRWNKDLLTTIDEKILNDYLILFHSKRLNKKINLLKKYINA